MWMRRRDFIVGISRAAVWPLAARAQPTMATIGYLDLRPVGAASRDWGEAFRQGLADTGLVEGRNIAIEYRSANGHGDRLAALAADLVLQRVALIFAPTGRA